MNLRRTMLFNSLDYLVFLPVVAVVYFWLPHAHRWRWLLAASCYFYMVFIPVYVLVLFLTIGVDYVAGLKIEGATGRARRAYLIASITANIGVLAAFKYAAFLTENVVGMLGLVGYHFSDPPFLQMILPVGLSFHTFQAMSYTIEVYRGRQPAQRHLGIYALYVMFFPQLVAGPIERPQHLLPQLHAKHRFEYDAAVDGLLQILWGLVKKVVVADALAPYVNEVYAAPRQFAGSQLVVATVFFAFQIYCDFSGYTDIAIGSARILGIRLVRNFDQPYFARSIAEFWRRWHISLSGWFRDYVYLPLGGNRTTAVRWARNVMITFLLSGLWHGANWTFVVWGALNGVYLIAGQVSSPLRSVVRDALHIDRYAPRVLAVWQMACTFALTCFAWVFFRARSLDDAVYVATHLFSGLTVEGLAHAARGRGLRQVVFLLAVELVQRHAGSIRSLVRAAPWWIRWPAYCAACLVVLLYGVVSSEQRTFIYFQF